MDEQKLSASLEDYLEAIYNIAKDKGAAKAKDISVRLEVNSSSVTGALRALSKRGLVNYAPYDLISLTPEGNILAKDLVTRHESLYKFFISILAIDKPDAEDAACKIEHVIPRTVLNRLINFAAFCESCPQGKPIWVEGKGFEWSKDKNS